jgi:hypothetical protein
MAVKIEVVERDSFRGPETLGWMVCLTEEDAIAFKEEYNARNNLPTVPEYYTVVEGRPISIELNIYQLLKLKSKGKKNRMWLSELENLQ